MRTHAIVLAALFLAACEPRHRGAGAAAAPTAAPTAAQPVATATGSAPAATAPAATTAAPASAPALLPAIVGAEARRAEIRAVIAELVGSLTGNELARVKNIPLVFDPDDAEINAFAGCEKGAPFMATTEGFNLAVDAVANTKATDELFGTKTYDAYSASLPERLSKKGGVPSLLPGTIPAQYENDPKRQSRAHEIFDDLTAFALGHELAHHYLGHTGCANGQAPTSGPNPAVVGHIITDIIPVLNQPIELAADTSGTRNVLAAGRARRPRFGWSEAGGYLLFDFFGRLEANAPMIAKVAFLRTHPESKIRIPFVQAAAKQWRSENPG